MSITDPKDSLRKYLQRARDAMLWKLEGLSEYDARRPLVPTGTNLLGLVKHMIGNEFVYFGTTFGRPSPDEPPFDEDDPTADLFATPEESREQIVELLAETQRHAGHADIVRELIDGDVGLNENNTNLPDDPSWEEHWARVEAAAKQAAGG